MKKEKTAHLAATMSIGDLVLKAMRGNDREGSMLRRAYIIGLWEDVVGKSMAARTQQIFLKDGKLFVEINSSAARNELLMLRSDIIRRINEKAQTQLVLELILK